MYLTVHGASGILIGSQVGNPWLAFLIGFISHFVLDIIPHDSKELKEWYDIGKTLNKFTIIVIIDILIMIILGIVLSVWYNLVFTPAIIWGITGTLLPDFIWGGRELFKIKNAMLDKYEQLHFWSHKIFYKKIYLPLKYTIPIQLGSLVLFIILYLLL